MSADEMQKVNEWLENLCSVEKFEACSEEGILERITNAPDQTNKRKKAARRIVKAHEDFQKLPPHSYLEAKEKFWRRKKQKCWNQLGEECAFYHRRIEEIWEDWAQKTFVARVAFDEEGNATASNKAEKTQKIEFASSPAAAEQKKEYDPKMTASHHGEGALTNSTGEVKFESTRTYLRDQEDRIRKDYTMFRDIVREENNLINARMGSFSALQGFLWASAALTLRSIEEETKKISRAFITLIAAVGIIVTLESWYSIVQAKRAVSRHVFRWDRLLYIHQMKSKAVYLGPDVVGNREWVKPMFPWFLRWSWRYIPMYRPTLIVFVVAWSCVIIFVWSFEVASSTVE